MHSVCYKGGKKSPCRGKKKKNRLADEDLIGGEEVEARLVAFLSGEVYAAAFLTGSKRGSSPHAEKNLAFQLSSLQVTWSFSAGSRAV